MSNLKIKYRFDSEEDKKSWRTASLLFLRAVEKDLVSAGLTCTQVYFKRGARHSGAESGDARLLAFRNDPHAGDYGVELNININGITAGGNRGRVTGYYRYVEYEPSDQYPVGAKGPNHDLARLFVGDAQDIPAEIVSDAMIRACTRKRGVVRDTESGNSRGGRD